MARFLISKSVWLDSYDAADDTPLHIAARTGAEPICRLLAEAGAKLDLANKRGLTPLGEALAAGQVGAAELLLSLGAKVSVEARGWVAGADHTDVEDDLCL